MAERAAAKNESNDKPDATLTSQRVGSTGSENPAPGAPVVPRRMTVFEATQKREEQQDANMTAEKHIWVDNKTGDVLTDPEEAVNGATQLVGADAERYQTDRGGKGKKGSAASAATTTSGAPSEAEDGRPAWAKARPAAKNKARTKGENK